MPDYTRSETFVILNSLVNILRALAEYSLLLSSTEEAHLRTQIFFDFLVENALKIIESLFTGTNIEKIKRRNFGFRLQFIFLAAELLTFCYVLTSAYARPYVRTVFGGGSQGNPTGQGECNLFLAGNRVVRRAFGQQAFFLEGNRKTIVAFEKEVSLKA